MDHVSSNQSSYVKNLYDLVPQKCHWNVRIGIRLDLGDRASRTNTPNCSGWSWDGLGGITFVWQFCMFCASFAVGVWFKLCPLSCLHPITCRGGCHLSLCPCDASRVKCYRTEGIISVVMWVGGQWGGGGVGGSGGGGEAEWGRWWSGVGVVVKREWGRWWSGVGAVVKRSGGGGEAGVGAVVKREWGWWWSGSGCRISQL